MYETLFPTWECPDCGKINRFTGTFAEHCSHCGINHTLDWNSHTDREQEMNDLEQELLLAMGNVMNRLELDSDKLSAQTSIKGWFTLEDGRSIQISIKGEICDPNLLDEIPDTGGIVERYRDMVGFFGGNTEPVLLAQEEERERCKDIIMDFKRLAPSWKAAICGAIDNPRLRREKDDSH